jgi:hypothetical protein
MIYFIQDTGSRAIKIGVSRSPRERLADLQTAHPARLVLLGIMDGMQNEERALHSKFDRVHGEWFEPTPDLMSFIQKSAITAQSFSSVALSVTGQPHVISSPKRPLIHRLFVYRDAAMLVFLWLALVIIIVQAVYYLGMAIINHGWSGYHSFILIGSLVDLVVLHACIHRIGKRHNVPAALMAYSQPAS